MKYLLSAVILLIFSSCFNNSTNYKVIEDNLTGFIPKNSGAEYFKSDTIDNENIVEDWANQVLFKLKEPVLNVDSIKGEFVRLIWLRSFENPIVIRINKINETEYLIIKELKSKNKGNELQKILIDTIIGLDRSKWKKFINPIEQSNFWNSPFTGTEISKDGATWFLESRLNNHYNVIQRWDNGYLSSKELQNYLMPLLDFINEIISLKSIR